MNTHPLVSLMEMVRIGFRNLSRHRVKTAITLTAVAVSSMIYMLVDGLLTGMNIESMRNIVGFETGAAKIQTRLYFEKKDDSPMYENFGGWETYAEALDGRGYDTAPRFVFSGTIYSETGSAPMEFAAVDPPAEERMLHYAEYIETGRFIRNGEFALVIGTVAAEKLKVGIPQRPKTAELEAALSAMDEDDALFVRSLYETGEGRFILKKRLSPADLSRCWNIFAEGGRNNVRISTVIDIKAAPEVIRREKFEEDLLPPLSAEEKALILSVYEPDALTDSYFLQTDDADILNRVLNAMVRVDYAGAIRHINQLIMAEVVGVINAPDPANNGNVGYLPLDVLQDEAGLMLEGHVTELLIRKKNSRIEQLPGKPEAPETITAALTTALAGMGQDSFPAELGVYGWRGYVETFLKAAEGDKIQTRILTALLFILSFLGISNTMLMSILERTREIGMMRAQGMTDRQLVFTTMTEAAFIGLFGAFAGILLGCLINIPMVRYGLDISSIFDDGSISGYRIASVLRSAWHIPVIIAAGIGATLISALVALLPTRRALKMPITESLRFE